MIRDNNDIRNSEPGRSEKAAAWQTAIGLQAADGLSTSDYLRQISQKSINGQISIKDAREQLDYYYSVKNENDSGDTDIENADKSAANIAKILLEDQLVSGSEGFAKLHKKIFDGLYDNAGVIRLNEENRREWVLGGDTIITTNPENIAGELENCFSRESSFNYETQDSDSIISHLAGFTAALWKICAFGEGNTRLTAVFTILYIRQLGLEVKEDIFYKYAWYFHNALARANYRNIEKNIDFTPVYLERFFRNMLLGERWDLRNRYLHVRPAAEWSEQINLNTNASTGQVQIKKGASTIQEKEKKEISSGKEARDTGNETENIVKEARYTAKEAKEANQESEYSHRDSSEELENPNIQFLLVVLGDRFLSVKEIMDGLHLKGRDSFLKLYLNPAVNSGLVRLLYPKAPRHPRQKYLLSTQGLAALASIGPEMTARIRQHLGL